MGSKKYLSIVFLLVLLVLSACGKKESSEKGNPEAEKIAVEVAGQWLNLNDDGQYAQGWDLTSEYFKKAVGEEMWEKQLTAVREPLGKLIRRKVISREYMTSMPGAPDGEYVVIQYSTDFENKKNAIETVTPMKDKDGKWRVSAYFIK